MKKLFFLFLVFFILFSCAKEEIADQHYDYIMDKIKNTPQKNWDNLATQKIYFGHQSVGSNILDGVEMHLKNNPNIVLNIVKDDNPDLFNNPVFVHSAIGKNKNPKSKIDDFEKKIHNGIGNKATIAGFKFCYIDFNKDTNINELFQYYQTRMNKLANDFPNTQFIHFTVPLRSIQTGAKATIKKILNKDIGIADNHARNQFNQLLLKEYGHEPIFDIAFFESSYPNGKREFVTKNGEKIYVMIPEYTYDGGHLSEKGKTILGGEFLIFLSNLD